MTAHAKTPAGVTAARLVCESPAKKTRSQNCIIEYENIEIINGKATFMTSRTPQGLSHHEFDSEDAFSFELSKGQFFLNGFSNAWINRIGILFLRRVIAIRRMSPKA